MPSHKTAVIDQCGIDLIRKHFSLQAVGLKFHLFRPFARRIILINMGQSAAYNIRSCFAGSCIHTLIHIGQDIVIRIHITDVVSRCFFRAFFPRTCQSAVWLMHHMDHRVFLCIGITQRRGIVSAPIIHQYDLQIRKCLRFQAFDTGCKIFLHIINRYNNTYLWHIFSFLTVSEILFSQQIIKIRKKQEESVPCLICTA